MTTESSDNTADKQTWLVGSDDDCDIVINHSRVSGHHCQITRTGNRLEIQDVSSEHGTWLYGQPLMGPSPIRRSDRIMLGETVELLWPPELLDFQSIMTVGRSEENDVVLDKPNISGLHARLIDDGEHLWIEDCGSTNGVCLNRPENKVRRHKVVPTDAIYLGSTRITIDRIIQVAMNPNGLDGKALADRMADKLLSASSRSSQEDRERRDKRRVALLTAIAVASLLAGAIGAVSYSKFATPEPPAKTQKQ